MEYHSCGSGFLFTDQIRQSPSLRRSFFSLAQETFGLDLACWYENGGWQDRYLPHVLVHNGEIAANVSVNRMTFRLDGKLHSWIQLGTVMTHPRYRGMGLSRFLLETVLRRWQDRCECLYLFANDSVLDFYPKFGFIPAKERQLTIPVRPGPALLRRKLDPSNRSDRALLLEAYACSNPYSAFSMENNEGLFLFYLLGPFRDMLYVLPRQHMVVICWEENETLFCHELLGSASIDLQSLLNGIAGPGVRRAVLGFTPKCPVPDACAQPGDEHLFLLGGTWNPFASRPLQFPDISRA